MNEISITDEGSRTSDWLAKNQGLLTEYAVNIILAAVMLFSGLIFSRIVSKALDRVLSRRAIDVTVSCFLAVMVRYAIVAFTVTAVLGRLGLQTASVIAVMGAASLAVGLALQGSLSNFAAGVLLVTLRPLRTGEFVDVARRGGRNGSKRGGRCRHRCGSGWTGRQRLCTDKRGRAANVLFHGDFEPRYCFSGFLCFCS